MQNKELEDIFGGESESPKLRAQRIFEENAPFAATAIIDIMNSATSDAVRLRAAQHVVDRVIGPVGKEEQEDALDKFLKGMEALANGKGTA